MKKLAQCFNTAAQDSNPGPLSRESDVLPLSHGAVQLYVFFYELCYIDASSVKLTASSTFKYCEIFSVIVNKYSQLFFYNGNTRIGISKQGI